MARGSWDCRGGWWKVTSVKPGDKVILNWAIPCGSCFQCLKGNESLCENNSPVTNFGQVNSGHPPLERTQYQGADIKRSFNLGTISEYTVVKEAAVVKTISGISFAASSIIGCGVMTGYGSAVNVAKVLPGSSVVVIGCGGVGLNVIQGARIAGAGKIIAIDLKEDKLSFSQNFGSTHSIKASSKDRDLIKASNEVLSITDGRGADYAFECTGVPSLGAAPLAMIRNGGMAVQVSGIEQSISIDMNLFEWDKIYINPLYGKCQPSIDFPRLISLYEQGEILLDELITSTYSIDQLQTAFEDLIQGKNAKGVILFD